MVPPKSTIPPPRPIRSFVLRAGRMGSGQKRALAELAPRFVLPFAAQPIDPAAVFGRHAPLIVEIGFGMGDATAAVARASPEVDFIGVEVHPPGVGSLLRKIDAHGLSNLRVVQHDAVEVLQAMIAPDSLAGAMLFFPDPWPKKRHHKRRMIQPEFIELLATRMKAGAILHLATDWAPYAEHMLEVMAAAPGFENLSATGGSCPRPEWRPRTKYEQRGERLGHGVTDLVFRRTRAAR
jgi:tRNA (guanine-N7-)-methyltransferase